MKEKFRFLEHTADAKFQAYGRNLEEAFANAALATASLMWEPESVERKIRHSFRTEGGDIEQLLVRFLEEIIYLFETHRFLLASTEDIQIAETPGCCRLEAAFVGDETPAKYSFHGEVKAITYSQMEIERNDHVTLQVVVDL